MVPHRVVLLFSILLLLVPTKTAFGQRFGGGFKGGLAASEVSGDNLGGPDKLGWFASVFTNTSLSAFSKVQLELMYIQKGSRSRPNENNNFYDYRFSLQYAEIPVLLVFDFPFAGNSRFADRLSLETGLSASFLVGSSEFLNDFPVDASTNKPFNDAELNILLGMYYPIADWLEFQLRFSQGLTPIRPHLGGTQTWYNRGQYNTVWTFGLAWSFL
jgi:hypothetical protein